MEGIQYVYFEKVLILNTAMNYLIISTSLKICNLQPKAFKTLVASILGGLYSFSLLIPELDIYTGFLVKVMFSVAMIAIVIIPTTFKTFAKVLASFYLVAFATGGAMMGLGFMSNKGIIRFLADSMWWLLPLCMVVIYGSGHIIPKLWKVLNIERNCIIPVTIAVEGQQVHVDAFVDTGNNLCDPINGFPVVIVEKQALLPLIPTNLHDFVANDELNYEKLTDCDNSSWQTRLRLIPYEAVGTNNGLMVGIKPDYIQYEKEGQAQREAKVVVGIHQGSLAPNHKFQALFHPHLVV